MKPIPMIHPPASAGSEIDPVCRMTVDPKQAAGSYQHAGRTYYFCNQSCLNQFKADPQRYLKPAGAPAADQHIDPVCGMTVEPEHAAGMAEHKGKTYYFCSASCLKKFKAEPERYLDRGATQPAHAAASAADSDVDYTCPMDPEVRQKGPGACPKCGMALEPAEVTGPATRTEYTCPMHPEIVRSEPGNCPICGMALEPRTVTGEEVNPELVDMTRRFCCKPKPRQRPFIPSLPARPPRTPQPIRDTSTLLAP